MFTTGKGLCSHHVRSAQNLFENFETIGIHVLPLGNVYHMLHVITCSLVLVCLSIEIVCTNKSAPYRQAKVPYNDFFFKPLTDSNGSKSQGRQLAAPRRQWRIKNAAAILNAIRKVSSWHRCVIELFLCRIKTGKKLVRVSLRCARKRCTCLSVLEKTKPWQILKAWFSWAQKLFHQGTLVHLHPWKPKVFCHT